MFEVEKEKGAYKGLAVAEIVALVLLIVGGLNWLTVGLANWSFVTAIFAFSPALERAIYILVGLCAIYVAVITPVLVKHDRLAHAGEPRTFGAGGTV